MSGFSNTAHDPVPTHSFHDGWLQPVTEISQIQALVTHLSYLQLKKVSLISDIFVHGGGGSPGK